MRRNLLYLTLFAIVLAGCSKSKTPAPPNGGQTTKIKFEISSGNNQTLGVGRPSDDLPTVKLSGDGVTISGYVVEFKGSGCNSDLIQLAHFATSGLAAVNYRLAGNVGAQTLQATLLDAVSMKRIDSVTFNFTAIAPASGYNHAACTPNGGVLSLAKTGTGRLFAVFDSGDSDLRYSDDDGISWYPAKGFTPGHRFEAVRSDGKSQVVAYSITQGIYYSADNGTSWKLYMAPFVGDLGNSMSYTTSGKLFFSSRKNELYYSADNGANWAKLNNGPLGTTYPLYSTQEGTKGEFYVFADQVGIYKSIDQGKTWALLPGAAGGADRDGMFGFYVDPNKGWLYKSAQIPSPGVYLSKDGGNTYSVIINGNYYINFFYVNSGIMYLEDGLNTKIYKVDASNHLSTVYSDVSPVTLEGDFIVANNGNVILRSPILLDYIMP